MGIGVGEFISRQDVAVMICRAFEGIIGVPNVGFIDHADIDEYAIDHVNALKHNKIINGTPDGSFLPKNSCVRAEAAVIVYNTLGFMEGKHDVK